MEFKHGKIVPVEMVDEMKTSYINYAMSVIIGRALPDVRDGLKPVHRRCLYAMSELGLEPGKPHKKSARVVGEVLGKYHPHGDTAAYDTIVRMAQDFSLRYLLVDGQGNFGSVDGDSAAAMRYTEVKMTKFSMEMLADIDKETVNFVPNFDESLEEPEVLPSRVPNLLVNGSSGIAVGMATNMPPHNLTEVIEAIDMLIKDKDVPIDNLMRVITGPDFPTGGIIVGREGIRKAYRTGRGTVKVRSRAVIENMAGGKTRIIVNELPYQVNKARLIENIANLVKDKVLDGLTDLRDESDRNGMRIVIELRRDANPNVILNQLYKHTQMQSSFGIINLAIVSGAPKVLNLREILVHYLNHQKDIVTRRTIYDLRKAEERGHILEGYRIALDSIEAVIKLIRGSKDTEAARRGLMENFSLSELQSNAILDMRLQRLTGLERDKIEAEYSELLKKIDYYKQILADETLLLHIIKTELDEVKRKFADARRTQIIDDEGEFNAEDLIAEEDVIVTLTHNGYIKRVTSDTYRSQRRGGKGIKGMNTKSEDFVEQLFITTTHHRMLFFTTRGKIFQLKVYEIPEQGRAARGTAIINLLQLDPGEKVNAVIPVREFESDQYLLMGTRNGVVKKTFMTDFENLRKSGMIAVTLDPGDELISVKMSMGGENIIIGTKKGMALTFSENNIRPTGRTSRGVRGIRLAEGDAVVGMDILTEGADILTVTNKGLGKRTRIDQYRIQGRGGRGVHAIKLTEKNGEVVALRLVKTGSELIMTSLDGVILCIKIDEIPLTGRQTQGNILMRLSNDDEVIDVAPNLRGNDRDDEEEEQ